MTLFLQTTQTVRGVAGTAAAVTYTVLGDEVSAGTDAFKVLAQGQLPNAVGVLYTVPSVTQTIVKAIALANTTGTAVTGCKLYVGGGAAINQLVSFDIPANGSAVYRDNCVFVFDSTGVPTVVQTAANIAFVPNGSLTSVNVQAALQELRDETIPLTYLDTDGTLVANSDTKLATQKAVKTYADGKVLDSIADADTTHAPSRNAVFDALALKQAQDADLDAIALLTTTAYGRALLTLADAAADTAQINAATFVLKGLETAAEHLLLNALDGRDSAGAVPRVFRPAQFMSGNTYDPTGAANSTTSFAAMMTAFNTLGDRAMIKLEPGVFRVDQSIITGLSTAPFLIEGPSRGICVLIPTGVAGDFIRLGAGSDGNALRGFAIYNTSGTPLAAGSGINTNSADSVLIEDMLFVDLFYDVRVNGRPVTATTNGTTAVSGISPALTAADVGRAFNGVGIPSGTTIATQAGATCTLSVAATTAATTTFFVDNTIKCSIQKTLHSQSNGNASSVGIRVENGDAGDTYIGVDIVMSNTGATRRRASIELIASGHYEITQANLTGSAQAILEDPGASQIVAFGFHTNVLCDSCTTNGMTLSAGTATSTIKNIKSVNSWYSGTVSGTGLSGVVTTGVAGGIINGITHTSDRFLNNQRHGYEHNFGTDFRWEGCDMKGNNAVGAIISTGYDGLNVAAGVGNFSVNGGKFGGTDTATVSTTQRFGISIGAGAGNNISLAPSDLSGNRDGPLQCGATGVAVFISPCPGLTPGAFLAARVTSNGAEVVVKSTTVPKNSTRATTSFEISGGGLYTNTIAAVTATIRVRIGSVTLTGTIPAGITCAGGTIARTNMPFSVSGLVTIQSIGAGGTIDGYLTMTLGNATQVLAGIPLFAAVSTAAVAVDTTADKLLELTSQSAAATTSLVWTAAKIVPVNY